MFVPKFAVETCKGRKELEDKLNDLEGCGFDIFCVLGSEEYKYTVISTWRAHNKGD